MAVEANLASLLGDAGVAEKAWTSLARTERGSSRASARSLARILARLRHEPLRALSVLGDDQNPLTRAIVVRELGDWAETERQVRLALAETPAPGAGSLPLRRARNQRTNLEPRLAEALAEQGLGREAATVIAETPLDCHLCVRVRGRVAALSGNAKLADHWYGEAVKIAPSLPAAEAEWARALLDRGDPEAALVRLASALRKSPRFADAIALSGEALLAKGDAAGAATRFEEAAKLTPRWGRLHLKWGEALAAQGKAAEAQAKWRLAAEMDLAAAERARLQALSEKQTT
jgi:tetratricopeptide (TPR) repeat protein